MRGSISKTAYGWQVTVDQGRDPFTHKRRRTAKTFATFAEAQDGLPAMLQAARGRTPAPKALTVGAHRVRRLTVATGPGSNTHSDRPRADGLHDATRSRTVIDEGKDLDEGPIMRRLDCLDARLDAVSSELREIVTEIRELLLRVMPEVSVGSLEDQPESLLDR